MTPLVSVLVTTHDRRLTGERADTWETPLRNTLARLSRQSYQLFNVWIGVDGESETFIPIVSEWKGFPDIHLTSSSGTPARQVGFNVRERLLKEADGEYVVFLNDDNIIYPDWMKSIMKEIDRINPDVLIYDILHELWGNLPRRWDRKPKYGDVDLLNYVVRRRLAQEVGMPWRHYEADFTFIDAVCSRIPPEKIFHLSSILAEHR